LLTKITESSKRTFLLVTEKPT